MRAARIFVSYSHSDAKWLRRLEQHLKPLLTDGSFELWSDERIAPGGHWRAEIAQAVRSCQVALLLVTPMFIASDFIQKNELPPLLSRASRHGIQILWLAVRYSNYADTQIAQYQALNDPEKPLISLRSAAIDKVLVSVSRSIRDAATAASGRMDMDARDPDGSERPARRQAGRLERNGTLLAVKPPHEHLELESRRDAVFLSDGRVRFEQFWKAVDSYRGNANDHSWEGRGRVDRLLASGFGRLSTDQLAQIVEAPEDGAVEMAAAVSLGFVERGENEDQVVELLVRLLSSTFERARYRAAGSIERRANRRQLSPGARILLHEALVAARKKEKGAAVREGFDAAITALESTV